MTDFVITGGKPENKVNILLENLVKDFYTGKTIVLRLPGCTYSIRKFSNNDISLYKNGLIIESFDSPETLIDYLKDLVEVLKL